MRVLVSIVLRIHRLHFVICGLLLDWYSLIKYLVLVRVWIILLKVYCLWYKLYEIYLGIRAASDPFTDFLYCCLRLSLVLRSSSPVRNPRSALFRSFLCSVHFFVILDLVPVLLQLLTSYLDRSDLGPIVPGCWSFCLISVQIFFRSLRSCYCLGSRSSSPVKTLRFVWFENYCSRITLYFRSGLLSCQSIAIILVILTSVDYVLCCYRVYFPVSDSTLPDSLLIGTSRCTTS